MCMFDHEFNTAVRELVEAGKAFDMLELTQKVREKVGADKQVHYIHRVNGQIVAGESVKFLALTAFEDGKMPGYVLDIKELPEGSGRKTAWVFRPIRYTPTKKWAILG